MLYELDLSIRKIDPAWPITANGQSTLSATTLKPTSISLNTSASSSTSSNASKVVDSNLKSLVNSTKSNSKLTNVASSNSTTANSNNNRMNYQQTNAKSSANIKQPINAVQEVIINIIIIINR